MIDRTGSWTLGVTDPSQNTVFLSDELSGNLLLRVLLHEMTHVTLWEYRILETYRLLGGKAIFYMPGIIERLVA